MAKSLYRTENVKLAEILRQIREQSGIVQGVLAERLGKSQTYVSNVELAIRRLDLVELRDYCNRGLGMELGELIAQWENSIRAVPGSAKPRRRK